jgi:adenine deaminase
LKANVLTAAERKTLIEVALGTLAPDLVIKNARLLNTLSREISHSDLAIKSGRIAACMPTGTATWLPAPVHDVGGRHVAPGLIDTHVHVESSMLTVREYSRAAVTNGVTMICADPHEIGNVLGIPGMRLLFDEALTVPMKMFLRVPGRIPAMPEWLETSGARVNIEETRSLMDWMEAICLAGDINPGLLIQKDDEQFEKIANAIARGMTVSGQSPGLTGAELNAFIAAGAEDSHVATSVAEIIENQRLGLRTVVAIRDDALYHKELRELGEAIRETGLDTRYLQFCTDDVYANEFVDVGHLNSHVRIAIAAGIDPMTAYQMATLNVAEGMRVERDYGSLTPGKYADLIVIDDLERVTVSATMIDGEWAFLDGEYRPGTKTFTYPQWARSTMRVRGDVSAADLAVTASGTVAASGNGKMARVRALAMCAPNGDMGTPKDEEHVVLEVVAGVVMPDPRQHVSSLAVIDRHKASGRIGLGFVSQLYVERGAVASTVCHDAHNLMVIGADHKDMAIAANRVIANGGGYAVALKGEILFEMTLPVAGLMSEDPLPVIAERIRRLEAVIYEVLGAPRRFKVLQQMNFLCLPNIPNYGFTDFGMMSTVELVSLDPVIAAGDLAFKHDGMR